MIDKNDNNRRASEPKAVADILISLFATGETKESRLCNLDAATQMMRGIIPLPDYILKERAGKRGVPVTLEDYTAAYRARLDEAIRQAAGNIELAKQDKSLRWLKRQAPFISIAAIYNGTGKANADITGMTQVCLVDVDGLTTEELNHARQTAQQDPHTLLLTVSLSGRGLHILATYEPDESHGTEGIKNSYKAVWTVINAHYEQLLGLKGDKSVSDPTRGSFLAHDPQLYLNPTAKPFTQEELAQNGGIEQSCRIGHIGKAREPRATREAPKDLDRLYDHTIQPFLERAGDTFVREHRHHYLTRLAHQLNQYGVQQDQAAAWAVSRFEQDDFDEREITSVIDGIYKNNADEFNTVRPPKSAKAGGKDKGERTRLATVADAEQWLPTQGQYRHNDITDKVEWQPADADTWRELNDTDVNTLRCRMSKQTGLFVRKADIEDTLHSEFAHRFNPITSYLKQVEEASHASHASDKSDVSDKSDISENPDIPELPDDPIARLAATVTVKGGPEAQAYWTECFRKWFVGMVATCGDTEEVNELVIVLVGGQGSFKTTWLRRIVPPELQHHLLVKTDSSTVSKDDKIAMCENILTIWEEFDTLTDKELSQLKAIITMPWVNERPPYGRHTVRRKHIASSCATGNNLQFLADRTGNRRFLPFTVDHIQDPRTIHYDYPALYAQAIALAKSGFRYWLDAADMATQTRHNRDFETPCMEQELVERYYRKPLPDEAETRCFVTATTAIQAFGGAITTKLTTQRVSAAFTTLGFKKVTVKGLRGYRAILRTPEEIKQHDAAMAGEAKEAG